MVPVTKPNTKEVQCQLTACDESKLQPEVMLTPKSGRVGIFNAEDFLSRAQMNDKINNILRSPTKAPNGVRQRSVYTNNNPSPQTSMRLSGTASSLSSRMSSMSLNSGSASASVGTNTAVLAKECSSQTNASCGAGSYRGIGMPMHQSQPMLSAIAPDLEPIVHGAKSMTARFAPFGYENASPYCPPPQPQIHHTQQFPSPMPPPPHALGRVTSRTFDFENAPPPPPPCPGSGPIAMSNGTIQLRLREGVRIDMTLDKAVRVLNQRSMVAVSLSRNGTNSALIHPNGRILQSGSKVEIVTYDGMKTNNFVRYAKMWYKGVSFTSESCALIYLVDTAGTRTTTDTFTDLTKDYTLAVFYDDSRHGPSFVPDAQEVIAKSSYSCADDGTEMYDINGFRIIQAADGLVKVTRQHNKGLIRTSPGNGSVTLTTLGIHCTASLGKTSHLFLRRNEKRMHFDGSNFIVRNAGHSAGFNENNLLIVY
ncbi:uncharacterized protein LOC133841479 isoform X1 [Drosophila sulfurigaster albostrigata]|uniref:uncharacterized protein LOC132791336 isoform X1 n=1 Tax=Drosophila nasuta TaxID=42062 RepID=UPI00295EC0C8|nr:uncharacterized protein LOC132791336 isoform X1 [Drosophila nasuta]XP_062129982.1 uncharacterized protein LOC133841479 isoform X1 [Drosophila sulfurigaster albostrigata]